MENKLKAVEALDRVLTMVYNIEGDRWQMAYDVLEGILANLAIEVKNTGEHK